MPNQPKFSKADVKKAQDWADSSAGQRAIKKSFKVANAVTEAMNASQLPSIPSHEFSS